MTLYATTPFVSEHHKDSLTTGKKYKVIKEVRGGKFFLFEDDLGWDWLGT